MFNDDQAISKKNELDKFDKPIIGYFGTVETRVDIDLIVKIAKQHKDKEIVICGPVWPVVKHEMHKKTKGLKNIHFTGRIKYEEAPSYINKFDVAIIPHKVTDFVKTMNPMKMYEYLACGKPVVSTPGAGIEMFKEHIYIEKDPQKFVDSISKAIETDSAEKQATRRNIVKKHSWQNRADKMTELLFEKLNSKS